jgi:hypothetical protein
MGSEPVPRWLNECSAGTNAQIAITGNPAGSIAICTACGVAYGRTSDGEWQPAGNGAWLPASLQTALAVARQRFRPVRPTCQPSSPQIRTNPFGM